MKLIIVEGPDNTGKTTVVNHINELLTNYAGIDKSRILVIHCEKPEGNTNDERIKNINTYNETLIDNLIDAAENNIWDYIILDRSWYSEGVYGPIYRNRDYDDYMSTLLDYDRKLSLAYKNYNKDVWLIMLNANNAEFLLQHEDGKSLSMNTSTALEHMFKEIDAFNYIFDNIALCNKVRVNVNKPDENEFKAFDDIMDEINAKIF